MLGERNSMTTAIPSEGIILIFCLKPLGLPGVLLVLEGRGREGIEIGVLLNRSGLVGTLAGADEGCF